MIPYIYIYSNGYTSIHGIISNVCVVYHYTFCGVIYDQSNVHRQQMLWIHTQTYTNINRSIDRYVEINIDRKKRISKVSMKGVWARMCGFYISIGDYDDIFGFDRDAEVEWSDLDVVTLTRNIEFGINIQSYMIWWWWWWGWRYSVRALFLLLLLLLLLSLLCVIVVLSIVLRDLYSRISVHLACGRESVWGSCSCRDVGDLPFPPYQIPKEPMMHEGEDDSSSCFSVSGSSLFF